MKTASFRHAIERNDQPKAILGIDPGLKGALVILHLENNSITKYAMPTIGNLIDAVKTSWLIKDAITTYGTGLFVAMEENVVRPNMSAKSAATFFRQIGAFDGILAYAGISHAYCSPQTWQRPFHKGLPNPYRTRPASPDKIAKGKSLLAAKRLFPNEPLVPTSQHGKSEYHDGVVDALLIAEYMRRSLFGEAAG